MKKQAGFTLIELIMVIVILGVLSAFALPRFADLGGEARTASINGLAGALRSAANIAHADHLASGTTQGAALTIEGVAVAMVNGYPQAVAGGIGNAASVVATDYTGTAGGTGGGATVTYTITGYTAPAGTFCRVVYTAATNNTDNDGSITGAPTVVTTVDGC